MIEVLGPPLSSFEIVGPVPTGDGFRSSTIKIVYKTLAFACEDEMLLIAKGEEQLSLIREWGSEELEMRILWWRSHPSIEVFDAARANQRLRRKSHPQGFYFHCRLATTPEMPEALVSKLLFRPDSTDAVWI